MREYGIVHRRLPNELHRGPMTKEEATEWLSGWVDDGGKPDVFFIVSRNVYVGPWKLTNVGKTESDMDSLGPRLEWISDAGN